jgi:DNA-binding NarL/FixJ family response regulator
MRKEMRRGSSGAPKTAAAPARAIRPSRVLIADDHGVVRRGLTALLIDQAKWVVCGEAADGLEAVAKAGELKPDIVVMDIGMPELNGLEATRRILAANPALKVLILTMHASEQVVREVLEAGARAYVLKSDADRDLLAALEALREEKSFFTTKVSQMVLDGYLRAGHTVPEMPARSLTGRQRDIVRLLAEGKSNKEVAAALNISVKTVETHRTNIMHKLDLHAFSELVRYAVRQKIVDA